MGPYDMSRDVDSMRRAMASVSVDETLVRLVDAEIAAAEAESRPVDLHGLPLDRLPDSHLAGRDLSGGNFEGCRMPRDCSGMVLDGANLRGCTIQNSRWTDVSAKGADFGKSNLCDVDLSGFVADGANFSRSAWVGIMCDGRTSLSGANVTGLVVDSGTGISEALEGAVTDSPSESPVVYDHQSYVSPVEGVFRSVEHDDPSVESLGAYRKEYGHSSLSAQVPQPGGHVYQPPRVSWPEESWPEEMGSQSGPGIMDSVRDSLLRGVDKFRSGSDLLRDGVSDGHHAPDESGLRGSSPLTGPEVSVDGDSDDISL